MRQKCNKVRYLLKTDVFARILHYTMDFARNIENVRLYNLARIFVLLLLKFLIVKNKKRFYSNVYWLTGRW